MSENGNEQEQQGAPAPTEAPEAPEAPAGGRSSRKVRVGVVVSDKAQKTIVVQVERRFAHPLYGKGVARTRRYHVHDENNDYRVGDTVRIAETRPLSKTKRWRVMGLVDRPA
jgi:small subunit ribosomal protein S17